MKKSLEENSKIPGTAPQQPLSSQRSAAGPDGSQIEEDQFLDCEQQAKLQLGGFAAKAVLWIVTLLICVGIWILLGLLVRWFVAPSPFPLT
jgi:hypothetical protein